MNILSNSHELDWQIANLLQDYIVGVTTRDGDAFDMRVDRIEPDGFVTLVGPRVTFADEFDLLDGHADPVIHEERWITLVDIDTLEVF